MKSSSLHLFCTFDDLKSWLTLLSKKFSLDAVLFALGKERVTIMVTPEEGISFPARLNRVFLFPRDSTHVKHVKLEIDEIEAIAWGWIDVRPGHAVIVQGKMVLTETQIYGCDGEFKGAKALIWLKTQIKSKVKFGVYGLDPETKRGSPYKSLGYTASALEILNNDGLWKTGEKNAAIFIPMQ